jgi:hypothetical protein
MMKLILIWGVGRGGDGGDGFFLFVLTVLSLREAATKNKVCSVLTLLFARRSTCEVSKGKSHNEMMMEAEAKVIWNLGYEITFLYRIVAFL